MIRMFEDPVLLCFFFWIKLSLIFFSQLQGLFIIFLSFFEFRRSNKNLKKILKNIVIRYLSKFELNLRVRASSIKRKGRYFMPNKSLLSFSKDLVF